MSTITSVLVFGDQTQDPCLLIKHLLRRSRASPAARSFLQKSSDVLRDETSKLSQIERAIFKSFYSIADLADKHSQRGILDTAVATVLHCVAQLGHLIIRLETIPNASDLKEPRSIIVGSCTGLIPAATAATIQSVGELLHASPQIISFALRLGLETRCRSTDIEWSSDSWATVVLGVSEEEVRGEVERWNSSCSVPQCNDAYISAVSDESCTISGPPSAIAGLISSSSKLSTAHKAKLPIAAAFHASHLALIDARRLIGATSTLERFQMKEVAFYSPSTGRPWLGLNLKELLREVSVEILARATYWTKAIRAITQDIDTKAVELASIGSSNTAKAIKLTLEKQGKIVSMTENSDYSNFSDCRSWESTDIAITGISGRFPGAEDLDDFWRLLVDGRDMHREIPADRFDVGSHCSVSKNTTNTSLSPFGCFLERPGFFDAKLFNMSPREASQTDPGQRLMLLTTYEALEMAGYSPNATPSFHQDRMGTFFGQTTDDWREHNASQNIDIYYVTGGIRAFGSGRLNYHFKWGGPSYSFDTACSSSSVAIQMARSALISRECDTAVAGGVNILTGSDMFAGLSRGGFLSTTGPCKTFDQDADGYCRADGAGSIVMKRLNDAITDGDNIQAILRGAATNHSANAVSITQPHAQTQENLYCQLLRDADVEAEEIGYVEMHGTGTKAGDSVELASVANALARGRNPASPLRIGAVKANVGHSEAAAGVTSVIKAILMMRHKIIPPHIGIKNRVNVSFHQSEMKNLHIPRIQTRLENQDASTEACKVLVNNFSAAGGNTSLLLQEPPSRALKGVDPRTPLPVLVSAKTRKSLVANLEKLSIYLEAHPGTDLADLAYTTSARRMHHSYRRAFAVKDISEAKDFLNKAILDTNERTAGRTVGSDHTIFVFSGQGSQYPGMGADLFRFCKVFREKALECERIALELGFSSFIQLIDGTPLADDTVSSPLQTQLALTTLEISVAKLWESWGVYPTLVLGHSLGEYAALHVSGVISLASTLYLVGERAKLMESFCIPNSNSMLAVRASMQQIQNYLQQSGTLCEVSCVNGPQSVVVSGPNDQIAALENFLSVRHIRTTILKVPFALHSSQMDPILEEIEAIAEGVHYSRAKIPLISTANGCMVEHGKIAWSSYLKRQTRDPVLMLAAVSACREQGDSEDDTIWIECGPGVACLNMIKAIVGTSAVNLLASLDCRQTGWSTISKSVGRAYEKGLDISWPDFHSDYRNCLRVLELPRYSFDLENHWIQYKGNWSITKGNFASTNTAPSKYTACVHRLVSTTTENNATKAVFESDLDDASLKGLIYGHHVQGFNLCPASVFTEMAFAAAYHMHFQGKNPGVDNLPAMELRNVEILKPLILGSSSILQRVQIVCLQNTDTSIISVIINSIDGSKTMEHARCVVSFGDANAWQAEWARYRHFIEDAQTHLVQSVSANKTHKLLRSVVYRLFSSIVDYDEKYQSLEEVVMNDGLHEATANIKLHETNIDRNCIHNPYWIDCLAQLGGFVLNGSPSASQDIVYLAHCWDSLRLPNRLSSQKKYTCHVQMMPSSSEKIMIGDVYLLDRDNIMATCHGLRFQQIKKNVLLSLLSPATPKLHAPQAPSGLGDKHLSTKLGQGGPFHGSSLSIQSSNTSTLASSEQDVDMCEKIALIIAAEIGIPRDEISETSVFADMGLDSLLSVSVLARIREETGHTLSSSFFNSNPRVKDIRLNINQAVWQRKENPILHESSSGKDRSPQNADTQLHDPKHGSQSVPLGVDEDMLSITCPIVHLQGSHSSFPALFLLPDGAGSAQSYKQLPMISSTLAVFGIDSAFYTRPQEYRIPFDAMASAFIRAIRSVQVHGPYILGGWSMGGIYAYEAARQLLSAGEAVQNLIMIDSPCPGTLPPLPAPTLSILEGSGLFDGMRTLGRGIPEATREHFLQSVVALENWSPVAMSPAMGRPEQVDVIWGQDGLLDGMTEEQQELSEESWVRETEGIGAQAKDWLNGRRDSYGPAGWDRMTGQSNVRCHVVKGHHFSMMRAPHV
ncbi:MAG: hypothetical protein Q9166_007882, partial [cf. Caloplaca sp. 2 TL-2023]